MSRDHRPRLWRETLFWLDRDHVVFWILGLPYRDESEGRDIVVYVFSMRN